MTTGGGGHSEGQNVHLSDYIEKDRRVGVGQLVGWVAIILSTWGALAISWNDQRRDIREMREDITALQAQTAQMMTKNDAENIRSEVKVFKEDANKDRDTKARESAENFTAIRNQIAPLPAMNVTVETLREGQAESKEFFKEFGRKLDAINDSLADVKSDVKVLKNSDDTLRRNQGREGRLGSTAPTLAER